MLTRTDVERIVENILKSDVKIVVGPGILANWRTIKLMYKGVVISSDSIDIEAQTEYYK